MFRLVLIFSAILVVLALLRWAWDWFKKNRVRLNLNRPPTPGELYFLAAAFQILRRALRLFLRR